MKEVVAIKWKVPLKIILNIQGVKAKYFAIIFPIYDFAGLLESMADFPIY